jgi:hypothetical protein
MEKLTFKEYIKPSKVILRGFIIWIGLNFIILFFTYTDDLDEIYVSSSDTQLYCINIINSEPDHTFWPFVNYINKSVYFEKLPPPPSERNIVDLYRKEEYEKKEIFYFYGIFHGYDFSEFLVYTFGFILFYFLIKSFKYLSK